MPNQEVGAAYVSVYPKLTNEWDKIGDEAGTKMGSGFTSKTGAFAVAAGNLLTKAISNAIDFIMDDLDEGIAKADMLNQFPKVLQNMGFEASAAESSIATIMDRLRGLPTATQDLLPFVEAIASVTKDLDKATAFGLAFNDMLLANSASSGDAARAMEMFDKMLSTGEYSAVRWTSILGVMRPQLDQVAESMLGAGANAMDLGDALGNGTVSFDELMQAIIDLDQNGGEAFASFSDQAKTASGGIQTSIDNMHNRIQTGWKEIIDAIGSENIEAVFNGIGDAIYSVMYGIAHFEEVCQAMYDFVEGIVFGIGDFFMGMFESIMGVFNGIYDGFEAFADLLYAGVSGAVDSIASTVTSVVDGIASTVDSVFGGMRDTVVGIWDSLTAKAGEAFNSIKSFIEDPIGSAASFISGKVEEILGFFSGLGDRITSAIGSIHFPQPQIDWEPLEIGGVKTISIPKVTWHAKGGYFNDPTLIGVGEAGGELLLPQSGGVMDPFADTVAERVGEDDDRIIAWLDENLPYIIARYTPTIGQRDFDRMARRATA